MAEEFPAARSIEAFFLNPAYIMENPRQPSNLVKEHQHRDSGAMSAHSDSMNSFKFDLTHERQISTATIKSVAHEPVFWHGYTSDEEAPSPIEVDDLEWDEEEDARFSNLPSLNASEEQIASAVSQASQLCTHAQAVTILSAGRPKVVTVPKLADAPRPERDPRTSLPIQSRETMASPHLRSYSLDAPSNERSSGEYSQKDSLDSSGRVSPLSTAPSSINEQPPQPHRMSVSSKHVPLMEAARHVPLMEAARMTSPISPSSPAGLKSSYTWSQPTAVPTSAPSVPRSSMSQIKSGVLSALINRFESSSDSSSGRRNSKSSSGTNNISRMGKNILRRDTLEDIEDEYMSRIAADSTQQPASPIIRLPTTRSHKPEKLVARGANERAPVLTLPQCPEDDFGRCFESEWPLNTATARITTVA